MEPGGEHKERWSPKRAVLRRVMWYRERLLGGGFRAAEALEAHELHERTFHRDIGYLRTLDWDLHFCRSERKWTLTDGHAPLPEIRLASQGAPDGLRV